MSKKRSLKVYVSQADINKGQAGVQSNRCLECPIAVALQRKYGGQWMVGSIVRDMLSNVGYSLPYKAEAFMNNADAERYDKCSTSVLRPFSFEMWPV